MRSISYAKPIRGNPHKVRKDDFVREPRLWEVRATAKNVSGSGRQPTVRATDPLDVGGREPLDQAEQVDLARHLLAEDQRGQPVMLGGHGLRLRQHLAEQPPTPQRQPPGQPRIAGDGRPHLLDHDRRLAQLAAHLEHQGSRLLVEHRPDLAVEVLADRVADVGLHQALEPVAGGGHPVVGLQRPEERRHRLVGVLAHLDQPLAQQVEVPELALRDVRDPHALRQRRGQRRLRHQAARTRGTRRRRAGPAARSTPCRYSGSDNEGRTTSAAPDPPSALDGPAADVGSGVMEGR